MEAAAAEVFRTAVFGGREKASGGREKAYSGKRMLSTDGQVCAFRWAVCL
jgi:hypothetical protein